MQPVIIDAITVCVLVGFTIYGAHRGLFRSLAGLAAVVLALFGAGLIARTVTPPVTELVAPMLQTHLEQRVEEALSNEAQPELPEQDRLTQLLEQLGVDPEIVERVTQQTMEKLEEAGATLAGAIVESLTTSLLYGILFLLSFLVLLLLLHLAARAMDLVLKLPGLHGLNALGGAAFGLMEGGLLLFLAIWAARHLGVSFETELVEATRVFRFFTTNTPLSALSFLL